MNALVRGWQRFWFERTSTSTVALVRIAVGIVAFLWTVSLAPDLLTFFSRTGILREQIAGRWEWGLLRTFTATPVVVTLYVLLLIASLSLIVGFHARLSSLIVFLGVLSFERRNAYIFNAGDGLVRLLCLFVLLMPSGAALSLDRWRKAKAQFWESPLRSHWGIRLVQVQISVLYAATVWTKLRGTAWNDGTAVSYAFRVGDYIRFRAPSALWNNVWLVNVLTYVTLAVEFSLAVLVWNRRARPWVLVAGVALHVGIALTIQIGFFSMAVMAGYLAFIPPETAAGWIEALRSRMSRSRRVLLRRLAAPSGVVGGEGVTAAQPVRVANSISAGPAGAG